MFFVCLLQDESYDPSSVTECDDTSSVVHRPNRAYRSTDDGQNESGISSLASPPADLRHAMVINFFFLVIFFDLHNFIYIFLC